MWEIIKKWFLPIVEEDEKLVEDYLNKIPQKSKPLKVIDDGCCLCVKNEFEKIEGVNNSAIKLFKAVYKTQNCIKSK
jgi:hypothetical protein